MYRIDIPLLLLYAVFRWLWGRATLTLPGGGANQIKIQNNKKRDQRDRGIKIPNLGDEVPAVAVVLANAASRAARSDCLLVQAGFVPDPAVC